MSAKWDRTQPIRFFYGNAARELHEVLPPDEFENDTLDLRNEWSELNTLLDRASSHMNELKNTRREISFLLTDLKRMIR
jgi:hypothetical protein